MSARAIKRMQALAFKPKVFGNGMELGPWFAPEDKSTAQIDPHEKITTSGGTEMDFGDYWRGIDNGTRAVILEYPDVYDISDQSEPIWDALNASGFISGLAPTGEGYLDAPGLPLVSPVAITPGWWQITDDRALCVYPNPRAEDSYLVWTVVVPHDSAGPLNGKCVSPFASIFTVTSDGSFKPHWARHTPVTTSLVIFDFCAVLVAASIMQADPRVVASRKRPPARASRQKRRRDRPSYRSMTTIALPGLRYDKSTGHWTAKAGAGVAWHMVRGHYRLLTSDRYVNKQGQKVWVKPHSKGDPDKGATRKRYVPDSAG